MKHQCVEIVKKYVAKGKKFSSHFSSEMCEDFSSLNVRNPCAEIVLEFSSQYFPHIWPVRKTDIYNWKEKSVEISLHFSSHFTAPHFPHNFPYTYFSSHFPYIFPHIWHVKKTDIYNCKEKSVETSLHFPHILLLQVFLTIFLTFTFPHIFLTFFLTFGMWGKRTFTTLMWGKFVRKISGKCVENVRTLSGNFLTFSSHWNFIVVLQEKEVTVCPTTLRELKPFSFTSLVPPSMSMFFDMSIARPSYRNASQFPWKKNAILAFSQAALRRTFEPP